MKTFPQPWTAVMEAIHLHRLAQRLCASPCRGVESGASADAACYRRGQEEKTFGQLFVGYQFRMRTPMPLADLERWLRPQAAAKA
jgi:hypothetical protein